MRITGACGEESDPAAITASESRGRATVTPIVAVISRQACWTALVTSSRGDDRGIVGELAPVVRVFGGTTEIQKEIIGRSLGL
jgi:hypothetical protein